MIIVYPLPGGMGRGTYEPGATDRERAAKRELRAERGEPGAMGRRYAPSAAKALRGGEKRPLRGEGVRDRGARGAG